MEVDCGGDVATARRQVDDVLLPEPAWVKEERLVELLAQEQKQRDKKLIADTIRRKVELGTFFVWERKFFFAGKEKVSGVTYFFFFLFLLPTCLWFRMIDNFL